MRQEILRLENIYPMKKFIKVARKLHNKLNKVKDRREQRELRRLLKNITNERDKLDNVIKHLTRKFGYKAIPVNFEIPTNVEPSFNPLNPTVHVS